MEKGLAIIEVTDTETRGFFVDQEAVEMARLSSAIKRNREKHEAERRVADRNRRRAEKAEARRKAYNLNTVFYILIRCVICAAVVWAGMARLIHPVIFIPVSLFCLCAACLRLGEWIGRNGNRHKA